MRLGVVLMGTGVYGAAGAGVLMELWRRKIEPYAVCGIGSGAWPAALYAAGCDTAQMEIASAQAQHMGRRMLRKARGGITGKAAALYTADGMQRLLHIQTGGRILALCPRKALFPVRSGRTDSVVFASLGCTPKEGIVPVMQVSAAFAARAAMGLPPFLKPLEWRGSSLLPMKNEADAAQLLFASGAQRVLIVQANSSPQAAPDPLLLAAECAKTPGKGQTPGVIHLTVQMPPHIGTLDFEEICACMELGRHTAELELDRLMESAGMACCRVLPFKRL